MIVHCYGPGKKINENNVLKFFREIKNSNQNYLLDSTYSNGIFHVSYCRFEFLEMEFWRIHQRKAKFSRNFTRMSTKFFHGFIIGQMGGMYLSSRNS